MTVSSLSAQVDLQLARHPAGTSRVQLSPIVVLAAADFEVWNLLPPRRGLELDRLAYVDAFLQAQVDYWRAADRDPVPAIAKRQRSRHAV